MNIRRSLVSILFVFVLVGATALPAVASDKDRTSTMNYRQIFMETKGKHAKAIKLLLKNKLSLRHIITHAEALEAMADDMLLLFPAGTIGGKSRAMGDIWDKDGKITSEFTAKAIDMRKEAAALAEVARGGNYKKIKKQMGRFANKGCRSCHTDYRGEYIEPK